MFHQGTYEAPQTGASRGQYYTGDAFWWKSSKNADYFSCSTAKRKSFYFQIKKSSPGLQRNSGTGTVLKESNGGFWLVLCLPSELGGI